MGAATLQRLVILTRDGLFHVRDGYGTWFKLLDRVDVKQVATAAEIREAILRHEAAQYPLPVYDTASGQYHWGDGDLWTEEDIADDIRKLWPLMDPDVLLESSRLMAKLGLHD